MLYRVEFIFNRPPTYCFILEAKSRTDARAQGMALAKRDGLNGWKSVQIREVAIKSLSQAPTT